MSDEIKKQLTFIDLFAGVGGLRRGFELAGHKCVGFCEWDKFATASYTSMHLITEEQKEYLKTLNKKKRQKEILKADYRNNEWYISDIKDVTGENVPKCDCWCFGAPCFVAGTPVTTSKGMKPIEEVEIGDMVLTHKNRFQKTLKTMKSVKSDIYTLKVKDTELIECTANHKFWICYYENQEFTKPCWKAICEFTGKEYCLSLIDCKESWLPVEKVNHDKNRIEIVYNLEVENDNSYTVSNLAVHNCTDFSIAGKRKGLEGDASSLIREVFRILWEIKEEDRPEWLVYENVKGMLSSNKGFDYLAIILEMEQLGYDIEWQNLNTKDFGPPQNRERIFTVGHLRRCGSAKLFPITTTNGKNCVQKVKQIGCCPSKTRNNPQNFRVYDSNGLSPTLNTMNGGHTEPMTPIPVGNTNPSGNGMNGMVYYSKGINPTLTTNKGDGSKIAIPLDIETQPVKYGDKFTVKEKLDTALTVCASNWRGIAGRNQDNNAVLLKCNPKSDLAIPVADPCRPNKDMNGRRFKENNDPAFTLTVQDKHGVAIGLEPEDIAIPVLTPDRENKRQNGRRFKENGDPSFTLTAQDRHGVAVNVPKTQTENLGCLRNVRSEYGKQIRKEYEANKINISRHEFLEKEIKKDGITNTVDTIPKDNLLAVKTEPVGGCYVGVTDKFGKGDIMEGCFRTLKAANHDSSVALKIEDNNKTNKNGGIFVKLSEDCTVYAIWYEKYQCYIAIRKLTPKECFRLQGWTDEYFERAEFVNSNSQLYKQAGNGVSVPVAYAVAKNMKLHSRNHE